PTQHPRAEPVPFGAGCARIRLAVDLPAADAAVELAERFFSGRCAAPGRVVAPGKHVAVFAGAPQLPGFEHHHVGPGLREHVGRHAAARPGADDGNVINLRRNDLHGSGYRLSAFGYRHPGECVTKGHWLRVISPCGAVIVWLQRLWY